MIFLILEKFKVDVLRIIFQLHGTLNISSKIINDLEQTYFLIWKQIINGIKPKEVLIWSKLTKIYLISRKNFQNNHYMNIIIYLKLVNLNIQWRIENEDED